MENTVFIKKYTEDMLSHVNQNEVWRYAGYGGDKSRINNELNAVLNEVISEMSGNFSYNVCFRKLDGVYPFSADSDSLKGLLNECVGTVIFAATVGLGTDRYIARMQKISPLRALLADALGAERIETLCDVFCNEIKSEFECDGLYLTRRFSPGYGDLKLTAQNEFFDLLNPSKHIGVSLNESLLMSPSKSVTAVMGLKKTKCDNQSTHKCSICNNTDCQFRKQENI